MLESLHRRPRGRALGRLLTAAGVAAPPAPVLDPAEDGYRVVLEPRELASVHSAHGRVTASLYDRLEPEDVEEVERRLEGEDAELWRSVPPEHRRSLTLAFGVHHRVPGVLERTGIDPVMPPPDVHAMSHVSTDAGGAYYYADLVEEALADAGFELRAGMAALDFGSSSGRVVRLLAHHWPDVEWHACDPNAGAIAWASEHLPKIRFFQSETEPPLPLEDGSLDVVVAISIWSHFAERAALAWLSEMRRVIRPGGVLVFTVQGLHGLQKVDAERLWLPRDVQDALQDLHRRGFAYLDVFGERGDHGVTSRDWGMSHVTAEWLATKLCPEWAILDFKPGRAEHHQDVVVIERRAGSLASTA